MAKMDKLKFHFTLKSSSDGKSSFMALTFITTPEEKTFCIPEFYQNISHHPELVKTAAFKKIRDSIKKRNQTRKMWIKLDETLSATYLAEGNNVQFNDYFLEEVKPSKPQTELTTKTDITEVETKLYKVTTVREDVDYFQDLRKLSRKFVLEKFPSKKSTSSQWINNFESECDRLEIETDEDKIEIMKFFLDKSCLEWYSSTLIKLTFDSGWNEWKNNFCETYADEGWNSVKYALHYKYINGSLLDYGLKKERLLLEIRKSMDTKTLIDLIAAGLPDIVTDRINRRELEHTRDLFDKLGNLEYLVKKNVAEKTKSMGSPPSKKMK